MALGTVESGTQSATSSHDLGSGSTAAGVYTCHWNLTNMANGNVVRCAVKRKVLTGDTAETAWEGWFANADGGGPPVIESDPIVSMFSVQCVVEEVGSATISVPWSLVRNAEY